MDVVHQLGRGMPIGQARGTKGASAANAHVA